MKWKGYLSTFRQTEVGANPFIFELFAKKIEQILPAQLGNLIPQLASRVPAFNLFRWAPIQISDSSAAIIILSMKNEIPVYRWSRSWDEHE